MVNIITLSTGESLIYDEDAEMFGGKIKWLNDEIELVLGKDRDAETADYAVDISSRILPNGIILLESMLLDIYRCIFLK